MIVMPVLIAGWCYVLAWLDIAGGSGGQALPILTVLPRAGRTRASVLRGCFWRFQSQLFHHHLQILHASPFCVDRAAEMPGGR